MSFDESYFTAVPSRLARTYVHLYLCPVGSPPHRLAPLWPSLVRIACVSLYVLTLPARTPRHPDHLNLWDVSRRLEARDHRTGIAPRRARFSRVRDRVARRVVDTACIEGGTDNDERKRSLMADTGRCGTPSAPLGALTSRRTRPRRTDRRVCAPDSARRPPGPMCADRVGATRFAPRAQTLRPATTLDARNRATGLETHTEAVYIHPLTPRHAPAG